MLVGFYQRLTAMFTTVRLSWREELTMFAPTHVWVPQNAQGEYLGPRAVLQSILNRRVSLQDEADACANRAALIMKDSTPKSTRTDRYKNLIVRGLIIMHGTCLENNVTYCALRHAYTTSAKRDLHTIIELTIIRGK